MIKPKFSSIIRLFFGSKLELSLPILCFIFSTGLWIIIGLCWADVAIQQGSGWSPLGATVTDGREVSEWGTRGTTASFRDIEADLTSGLNSAFPFEALRMKPLLPLRDTEIRGIDRVFDPKHGIFVASWLALPFIILLFKYRFGNPKVTSISMLVIMLLIVGYFLCWDATEAINQYGLTARHTSQIIIRDCFLVIIALCAIACGISLFAAIRYGLNGIKIHSLADRRLSACSSASNTWFAWILVASLLGFLAKISIWLGWYTNDTRINLFEPLSFSASLIGAGLAVIAMLFGAFIWHRDKRRFWYPVVLVICMLSIASSFFVWIIPNPPRLSNSYGHDHYILTTEGKLIEYGDWEASIRAGLPRQYIPLYVDRDELERYDREEPKRAEKIIKAGKENQKLPDCPRCRKIGFNSINEYSHLFGKAWLQIPLIIFAISALGSAIVISAWGLGSFVSAGFNSAKAGAWTLLSTVAVLWLISIALMLGLGRMGLNAIRAHSMDRVFMHARGEILIPAFGALMTYKTEEDLSGYWQLPWQLIRALYAEFDDNFYKMAYVENHILRQIGPYGATDNFFFSNDSELTARVDLLGNALQARANIFARCETFPDEIRFLLERKGFPPRLIEAAVTSWKRELMVLRAANIARLQRLTAEYNLLYWMAENRKYWTIDRPAAPPTFNDDKYLTEYVDRLSRIVDLKESEILKMRNLKSRLSWLDSDFPKNAEIALRFIAIQRKFLSYLSHPSRHIDSGSIQFKDAQLSKQYAAALKELETFGSPTSSEPVSALTGKYSVNH